VWLKPCARHSLRLVEFCLGKLAVAGCGQERGSPNVCISFSWALRQDLDRERGSTVVSVVVRAAGGHDAGGHAAGIDG